MKKETMNRLFAGTFLAGMAAAGVSAPQVAEAQEGGGKEIVVTGTRIQAPGLTSASPISTIGAEEIQLQQQSQVERILRVLPVSVPGDGDNTNNGTVGVASINLRGLGVQRNLILIDGKRATPYNDDGIVDVSTIPTVMLERVDVLTGGASATYGSDAISGAVNFVLRRDYQGVELETRYGETAEGDGQTYNAALAMGANIDGGRGNVALALNYSKREPVLFGDRPYGAVGVATASGAGLSAIGTVPPAPTNCGGENTVPPSFGGSGTTLPARINSVPTSTNFTSGSLQFRDDGSLGANCNVFNFNPYNYYQTPSERYGGLAYGRYEITDDIEAYARLMFSSTNVTTQIAPSGVFNAPFFVPLANPFLSTAARNELIARYQAGLTAVAPSATNPNPTPQTVLGTNWLDNNNNGVVDAADTVRFGLARRTPELGPRATSYDTNQFQLLFGVRGELPGDWNWDLGFSHGESDRTNLSTGYSNLSKVAGALNTVSATECRTAAGVVTAGCVPANLFNAQGTITPAQAAYLRADALEQQNYRQTYVTGSVSGPLTMVQSPFAETPVQTAFGVEYREEFGSVSPDECLKGSNGVSCLGGGGGNTLPLAGGFSVYEVFGEAIVPLIANAPLIQSADLELGYRYGDYDPTGINRTWKAGLNWSVTNDLRLRLMAQRAARAPNVGELASPQTSSLDNATQDPCSVANAANITPTLRALCVSTGMTASQVGVVPDIVAGQINSFGGTNLARLPEPETADTTTIGAVYRPSFLTFLNSPAISLDYYAIDIEGYIGALGAQEVLNSCYQAGQAGECAKIRRVDGNLIFPGSGVQLFTQNLAYKKTEGFDFGANFGIDAEKLSLPAWMGTFSFAYNATFVTKNEYRSSIASPVVDCLGYYVNQFECSRGNPTPEYKHVQRGTWTLGDFQVSYLWRRIGEVEASPVQRANTFDPFEQIDAFDYFDFTGSWNITPNFELTGSIQNAFEKDPPIVGGEASTTSANGGNTFPSTYDTIGRVMTIGARAKF